MKSTLRWLYPEGASIIDAMLFSREEVSSTQDEFTEIANKHLTILDQIHDILKAPEITHPWWHIYLREEEKPFLVCYPFGLAKTKPYNVRMCMDRCENKEIYEVEIAIRYNLPGSGYTNIFRPIICDGYLSVVDYHSVAASTQAIFHSLFPDHTANMMRYNPEVLFDSVSDYSSQRTILPVYNTHRKKALQ
jgi:hypothetical protein